MKRDDLVSEIFRSSLSEVLRKILAPEYFLKFQENLSLKVRHHLKGS